MTDAVELEDAWPVPEHPKGGGKAPTSERTPRGGGESAFLLNLISPVSREDLIPLAELEADEVLEAFLSGGSAPPRIVGLGIPEKQAARIASLVDAIFNDNYREISSRILHGIRDNPPHVLLVHLEDAQANPAAIIRMLCDDLERAAPDVIALVDRQNSPMLTTPPPWAKAVLPLSLPDSALGLQLRQFLHLALTRRDLEVIFLAHRVSREQLHRVTFTDPLTGLMNRAGFEDAAARELGRIARTGETMGLIILDIDHFKKINDTHGHPVGDSVLREVARILRKETRTLDYIVRIGGEEFGVILPHTHYENILLVAERIREQVEATHFENIPAAGDITISLGALCIHPKNRPGLDMVYPLCDELLYQAKQGGRNRVVSDRYE